MAERDEFPEDREASEERLEPLLDAALRRGFAAGSDSAETTWDPRDTAADPDLDDLPALPSRYLVSGELGRGGMGRVLRAEDRVMGRQVAIKVLHGTSDADAARIERFWEEGRIASQLEHPAIVPIYDLGRTADLDPYIAMKLVEGMTLRAHLRADPSPEHDRQRRLGWFLQVCQAVAYAHDRGVVHRDLKPDNVMIGRFGEVHVMDWGLARIVAEGEDPAPQARSPHFPDAWQTATGAAAGTPRYMAPEQARGERGRIGPHSDVYALGVILNEITVGPLSASKAESTSSADPALARIVADCLEEDPTRRIPDARALARRVSTWMESLEERARKAELKAFETQVRAEAEGRHARVRLRYAVGIVVLVLLGGAGALAWDLGRRAQSARTGRAVAEALDAANALRVQAMASGEESERLRLWTEAAESARRGLEVAVAGEGDADLRRRATDLARALEAAAERAHAAALRARREREIVHRIREIQTTHIRQNDFDEERAAYAQLLRSLGIDVASVPEADVVRRIEETGITSELRQALESWAVTYLGDHNEKSDPCVKLQGILEALDRDPFRRSLRSAAFNRRPDELLALARSPEMLEVDSGAVLLMGGTLGYVHGAGEAVDFYERMLGVDRSRIGHHLGVAYWSEKLDPPDRERSIAHYTAALALFPASATIRILFARAEHFRGHYGRALVLLDEAIALDPGSGPGHHNRGLALKRLERYVEAEASLLRAAELSPDWAPTIHELGIVADHQGKLGEATAWFRRAIALDSEDWQFHHNLGRCLRQLRRFEEARSQLEQAITLNPRDPRSYESLAAVFADQGDHSSALGLYDQALAVDPGFANAHYSRAIALLRLERFNESRASFLAAIALKDDDARYHINLAQVQTVLGRFEEAGRGFERARELVEAGQEVAVPLDRMIRECRGRARNEKRLRALLAGEHQPTDPREWLALSVLCQFKRTSVEEATLWKRAFDLDAPLVDAASGGIRYRGFAADAALRAGFGLGRDAGILSAAERRRWLEQGITWCRAEVEWWRARMDASSSERDRERLESWARRSGVASLLAVRERESSPASHAELSSQLRALLDQ